MLQRKNVSARERDRACLVVDTHATLLERTVGHDRPFDVRTHRSEKPSEAEPDNAEPDRPNPPWLAHVDGNDIIPIKAHRSGASA